MCDNAVRARVVCDRVVCVKEFCVTKLRVSVKQVLEEEEEEEKAAGCRGKTRTPHNEGNSFQKCNEAHACCALTCEKRNLTLYT